MPDYKAKYQELLETQRTAYIILDAASALLKKAYKEGTILIKKSEREEKQAIAE